MVRLLLGLSTFVSVPAASLLEAACTSCTRTGANAGSNAGTGLETNVGAGLETFVSVLAASLLEAACTSCTRTGTNPGSSVDSGSSKLRFTLSVTLSEGFGGSGNGGGVRHLVALEPLGDLGVGVVGEALLLARDGRGFGGGDEDNGGVCEARDCGGGDEDGSDC